MNIDSTIEGDLSAIELNVDAFSLYLPSDFMPLAICYGNWDTDRLVCEGNKIKQNTLKIAELVPEHLLSIFH